MACSREADRPGATNEARPHDSNLRHARFLWAISASPFASERRLAREHEYLTGIDQPRIANLRSVGRIDLFVAQAASVEMAADAPQAVASDDLRRVDIADNGVRRARRRRNFRGSLRRRPACEAGADGGLDGIASADATVEAAAGGAAAGSGLEGAAASEAGAPSVGPGAAAGEGGAGSGREGPAGEGGMASGRAGVGVAASFVCGCSEAAAGGLGDAATGVGDTAEAGGGGFAAALWSATSSG